MSRPKGFRVSEETKEKIRLRLIGKNKGHIPPNKGKTYEESYGIEKAQQLKINHSLKIKGKKQPPEVVEKRIKHQRGKHHSKEWREAIGKSHKGKIRDDETKRKISLKIRTQRMRELESSGKLHLASFNLTSCKFFDILDSFLNTLGRYGTATGEYYIKDLGYFLDYINFDLKFIVEWDEKYHYSALGQLREKDIIRQRAIMNYFPDFKFIRIKESETAKFSFNEISRALSHWI